jgi:hypothetical protein
MGDHERPASAGIYLHITRVILPAVHLAHYILCSVLYAALYAGGCRASVLFAGGAGGCALLGLGLFYATKVGLEVARRSGGGSKV